MLDINIFNRKSRKMYGHIILFIVLGLFITDIETQNRKRINIQPILQPYLNNLNRKAVTYFFEKESVVFHTVKSYYGFNTEASTSGHSEIGQPISEEIIRSLAHVTLLTFWIGINLRICALLFSNFESHKDENLSESCQSIFTEINFVFREFRNELESQVQNGDLEGRRIFDQVSNLSLEFISDEYTLSSQEPDKYNSDIILWDHIQTFKRMVNTTEKEYRTITFQLINQINELQLESVEEIFTNLKVLVLQYINRGPAWILFSYFTEKLEFNVTDFYFLPLWYIIVDQDALYHNNWELWKQLSVYKDNSIIQRRIRIWRTCALMELIRLNHYSILFSSVSYNAMVTAEILVVIEPIPASKLHGLDLHVLNMFFEKESEVFHTVKSYYGFNTEVSTSGHSEIGLPEKKIHIIRSLAHVTLLTFWIAINFRICTSLFSLFESYKNEELSQLCQSNFEEMNFIFHELKHQIAVQLVGQKAFNSILNLSLDFISDLCRREPDKYNPSIIFWGQIPSIFYECEKDGIIKEYKTFYPEGMKQCEDQTVGRTFQCLKSTVHKYINKEKVQLMSHNYTSKLQINIKDNNFLALWEVVIGEAALYYNNLKLWQQLRVFEITSVPKGTQRHVSQAIKLMEIIRLWHDTIIFNSISYNAMLPRNEEHI